MEINLNKTRVIRELVLVLKCVWNIVKDLLGPARNGLL